MTPFAILLDRYRRRAQLGRNELARAAGMDPSHVSRLCQGQREPTRAITLVLARGLGIEDRDTDRLLLAAGFAPDWMMALAGVARISPKEVSRVAS